jgi:hypothetical protein
VGFEPEPSVPMADAMTAASRRQGQMYSILYAMHSLYIEKMKKFLQTHPPITKAIRFFTLY